MIRVGVLAVSLCILLLSADSEYRREVEEWRQQRETKLKADDGWLTVVGLAWLKEGETRIGSDPENNVVLPAGAPPTVGVITLSGDSAQLRVEPGVKVMREGQPIEKGALRTDASGKPDVLAVGDVRLILLKRGPRYALRIKDNQSALRAGFAGLRWYPVSEDWRITAKFVPHRGQSTIVMDTIIGEPITLESPGYAVFEKDGKEYRLQAALEGDTLWFVFRDGTSGRTTHPGARQLNTDMPKDGAVVLDFNKAINLPCAFTAHATCPLAAPANRLKIAIEAGEMKYESRALSAAKAH